MTVRVLTLAALSIIASTASGFDPRDVVPPQIREQFRNFPAPGSGEGSCVWCAISMMGVDGNNPRAATMLENTQWGPANLGGAYPDMARQAFSQREIDAWHIEGNTRPWLEWCWRNRRTAAVTLTPYHMQWMVGGDPARGTVYVVDNNSPQRVDEWSVSEFFAQHESHGGGWTIILKGPRPAPWYGPETRKWWKDAQSKTPGRVGFDPGVIRMGLGG
jgi:hypothetical protein